MTKVSGNPQIRYDEGCLAAHALNVVGDRWALLVVRELMFRPKRFQLIRKGLPGLTASVLTQRLNNLIEAQVVRRDPYSSAYTLTASGQALLPVLQAMGRWGAHHPGHDPQRFISLSALVISMTAMVDQDRAKGHKTVAELVSGEETYWLQANQEGVILVKAEANEPADFTLVGRGNDLASAVYGRRPIRDTVQQRDLVMTGDADAAQRFVDLFDLKN